MPVVRRTGTISKPRRFLLQVLLLCLVLIIAGYFFIQSSFFNVSSIEISDNHFLSAGEIRQLADIPAGINIFKVDDMQIKQNLMLHPMIKDVFIKRQLPDTLFINIVERQPAILVPSETGFLELDDNGVFLRRLSTISNISLPVLTGVKVDGNVTPGQILANGSLEKALAFIDQIPAQYRIMVMEIELKADQYFVYTSQGVQVRLGNQEDLAPKFIILDELIKTGQLEDRFIEYVDLTTVATPVIKYRD